MRIGIVAQNHGEIFGVKQNYLNLIEEVGGTPVVISPVLAENFWKTYSSIEGLVLPGGSDVNPSRYGHLRSWWTYPANPYLEDFDTQILPLVVKKNLPIFGICRGLQTLNVHFGGSLWQHLTKHPQSKGYTDTVHKVRMSSTEKKFDVNSRHHQCIWKLADNFVATAYSEDGKIIEAISHKTLPIVAVQWHPEGIFDDFSIAQMRKIF
jgi:putative glutamine amidotransferase